MQNDIIKHSVYVQRFGGGLVKDFLPQLNKLRDKIVAKLSSPISLGYSKIELMSYESKLKEIDALIQATVTQNLNPDLWKDFAEYEDTFVTKLLDKNTAPSAVIISSGINAKALDTMLTKSTMTLGDAKPITIDKAIEIFSNRYVKDIKSEIEIGIAGGLTTDDIAKNIYHMSNNRTRTQANALIRTITNHVGNTAMSNVFDKHDKLFKGMQWVATLDTKTSEICISRDLKIYPLNNYPVPPAHYACRSRVVPILKDKYNIDDGTETRSSMNGYEKQTTNYNDWLKKQSADVQDEVLGKAKGELYRKNGMKISKFIDGDKFYTLEELKQKDLIE